MNKGTPKGKGIRTAIQAVIGGVIAYFTGLFALPEFQQYTSEFLRTEGFATLLAVLAAFGVGAGLISWIQNWWEDNR